MTEAGELHRRISASVRDLLDAFRLQAAAGPVTDKALEVLGSPGNGWTSPAACSASSRRRAAAGARSR
jgi:hypothetical protein